MAQEFLRKEQTDVKRATRPFLRGMGVARETSGCGGEDLAKKLLESIIDSNVLANRETPLPSFPSSAVTRSVCILMAYQSCLERFNHPLIL